MLTELTAEHERLMTEIGDAYLADVTRPTPPDEKAIMEWLKVVYGLYESQVPKIVEIVASPYEATRLATELCGETIATTDYCGIADFGWLAAQEFYRKIGIESAEDSQSSDALRAFARCAWDTLLLDEAAIVIRRPTALRVDDQGHLHSSTGPCIEWADGRRDWAWHGTWVPERIITAPRSYSREEYLAITNTEERRALAESAGWDWLLGMLGAKEADAWTDPMTGLRYRLLAMSGAGADDVGGTLLLEQQSPQLADGSQPTYVEPVDPRLRTAAAARKWQATMLTPEECERDPSLAYEIEA